MKDHIIIDPNFTEVPKKGIQKIFLTHEHEDHTNLEKIEEITRNYVNDKDKLEIYGPKSVKKEFNLNIKIIKKDKRIKLQNLIMEPYPIECYKSRGCFSYVITKGDVKILHTADSNKFSKNLRDLKQQIDFCFIACFKDYFNDYLNFLNELFPKITFPYHFNLGDESDAKNLVNFLNENGIESKYIQIGTEFEF